MTIVLEDTFTEGGKTYSIGMDTHTDTRHVIDSNQNIVVSIDSRCVVTKGTINVGKLVNRNEHWVLECFNGLILETGIAVKGYHWHQLLRAEIHVSRLVIGNSIKVA